MFIWNISTEPESTDLALTAQRTDKERPFSLSVFELFKRTLLLTDEAEKVIQRGPKDRMVSLVGTRPAALIASA
jgi:hypothetical protein